jgi:hypothetical protein
MCYIDGQKNKYSILVQIANKLGLQENLFLTQSHRPLMHGANSRKFSDE